MLCLLLLLDFLEPLAFKAGPTTARIKLLPAGHSRGEASASCRWCPWCVLSAVPDAGMWADGRSWAATLGREEGALC